MTKPKLTKAQREGLKYLCTYGWTPTWPYATATLESLHKRGYVEYGQMIVTGEQVHRLTPSGREVARGLK